MTIVEHGECLVAARPAPDLWLAAHARPPLVRAGGRVTRPGPRLVLPTGREHVLTTAKEITEQPELHRRRDRFCLADRFAMWTTRAEPVELGETLGRGGPQPIEFGESLLRLRDGVVQARRHAAILHGASERPPSQGQMLTDLPRSSGSSNRRDRRPPPEPLAERSHALARDLAPTGTPPRR